MDSQLEINDQLTDRIEYLERKVSELIDVVNTITEGFRMAREYEAGK